MKIVGEPGQSAEGLIEALLTRLRVTREQVKALTAQIRDTGGADEDTRAKMVLRVTENETFSLTSKQLADLSDLGLSLVIDVEC